MKLFYATSLYLPSVRANRIQILATARALRELLGDNFLLGVGSSAGIDGLHTVETGVAARSYRAAWHLVRYARRHNVTHVYCREEKLLFFMVLYAMFLRLPASFWYELHYMRYARSPWFRFALKRVAGVVAVTKGLRDAFAAAGYPRERITVAPDAVDVSFVDIPQSREEARRQLNLPQERSIVLYTGAINEAWKGVEVLHDAAKDFSEDALLLIVGGKSHYVEHFRSVHAALPNVRLVEHQPHEKIPLYLRAADVLVLPNSAKSEHSRIATSPMKLFEYMASERPIVASDLPSIREVLNERSALLVPPDDPKALAKGVEEALSNKEASAQRAAAAKTDTVNYSWEERAAKIVRFMQQP